MIPTKVNEKDFSLIHQSGHQAFHCGQPRESNPQPIGTDNRAAWFAGYDNAERDFATQLQALEGGAA